MGRATTGTDHNLATRKQAILDEGEGERVSEQDMAHGRRSASLEKS
jgi:hypothetical protein